VDARDKPGHVDARDKPGHDELPTQIAGELLCLKSRRHVLTVPAFALALFVGPSGRRIAFLPALALALVPVRKRVVALQALTGRRAAALALALRQRAARAGCECKRGDGNRENFLHCLHPFFSMLRSEDRACEVNERGAGLFLPAPRS